MINPGSRATGFRQPALAASGRSHLWDTGGIFGAGESELTQQVRRAAENALRESDLLLFVVDAKGRLVASG